MRKDLVQETRYGFTALRADWDRSVDLYLLTFQPEDGDIDLLLEVFMRQMQIHILGIGPVFWPRNKMGRSVEHFQPKA